MTKAVAVTQGGRLGRGGAPHDSGIHREGGTMLRSAIRAALALLVFCTSASAGTRLYTGSLIIEAFGNDTTTGNQPPFQSSKPIGIPLTGKCNARPYHAHETLRFPAGGPYTVTFTIPAYGGAVGSPPPGCGRATVKAGDPLVGGGAVVTTGAVAPRSPNDPRGFTIRRSDLSWVGSGASFQASGVYRWEVHAGALRNSNGVFAKGGGDGDFGFHSGPAGNPDRRISQTAGRNQFGGVMQLLGNYGGNEGYFIPIGGFTSVFSNTSWKFIYHGAGGQATQDGVVTHGYVGHGTTFGFTREYGSSVTSMVYAQAFKWTTGMVTVEAGQGTFPTHLARTGYDDRTEYGSGVIQLVSPMLTHWVGAGQSSTGSVAILKLHFAPEPHQWVMLGGGLGLLALVYRGRGPS